MYGLSFMTVGYCMQARFIKYNTIQDIATITISTNVNTYIIYIMLIVISRPKQISFYSFVNNCSRRRNYCLLI